MSSPRTETNEEGPMSAEMKNPVTEPVSTTDPAAAEAALLHRYHRLGDPRAREELVERMVPLVRHIARRYADRGEPLEDLVQVGCVGLINAIDRFDPDRGVRLSTFAAPTIAGEIKRHFRDKAWSVRVPRDLQELSAKITKATEAYASIHGRAPSVPELAVAVERSEEDVLEALQGAQSYTAASLDEPLGEERTSLDLLGGEDEGFAQTDRRLFVLEGLDCLAEREREIVRLRFWDGLTQREIADRVGVSQMHVSRLLRRSLVEMRAALADDGRATGGMDLRQLG
jgi:RNA polymerase sigma-B factor